LTATNSTPLPNDAADRESPESITVPAQVQTVPGQPVPDPASNPAPEADSPGPEPVVQSEPVITPGIQPEPKRHDTEAATPTPSPQPSNEKKKPRIIALMNQKGGVGKTTTCTNLGAALARLGQRVLMIDLDPQAHLTLSLGVDPDALDKSMYDLLADTSTQAHEVLQPIGEDGRMSILPAEVNLAGVEGELADKVVTGAAQAVLKQKVAELVPSLGSIQLPNFGGASTPEPTPQGEPLNPDYILIDCPPSLGLLTVNALTLASEVIVPMQAHFLALQGLGKLFETIAMMKQGINPSLSVAGVVLCMHEGNTILANEVISDVNGFLESARGTDAPWSDAVVYYPPIRRNIKLAESPSFGQSIFDYAPDCHGAQDYARLAESVIGQRVGGGS